MRQRAMSVRIVLARHRRAIGLMESRTSPGPATLRHHYVGRLREAWVLLELAAHAYLLDNIYGSTLQERGLLFDTPQETAALAQVMLARFPLTETTSPSSCSVRAAARLRLWRGARVRPRPDPRRPRKGPSDRPVTQPDRLR